MPVCERGELRLDRRLRASAAVACTTSARASPARARPPRRGAAPRATAASRAAAAPATTSATNSTAATRLATSVAVRQGRKASGAEERSLQRPLDSHAAARPPASTPRCGARPSSSGTSARQPSSRSMSDASSTERRTSPSRAASSRGARVEPATAAQAACRSRDRRLARRCRRCTGRRCVRRPRAARRRCRRRRRSRGSGAPSPKMTVSSPRAIRSRKIATTPPSRPASWRGAEDVREAERDVARAVDPVPAGEVLLAALLRDAVRRERQEREALVDRARALAVAGAAGRREDHLRAGRCGLRATLTVPTTFTSASNAGALHRRLDVRLGGEMEDDVGLDLERLADVVLEQPAAGFRFSRLPDREVVDDRRRRRPGRSEHRRGSSR